MARPCYPLYQKTQTPCKALHWQIGSLIAVLVKVGRTFSWLIPLQQLIGVLFGDVGVTTLDPLGPWHLAGTIKVPDCNNTLHFSTTHEAANISVVHTLKILLRVERGDDEALDAKGNRKRFDIVGRLPEQGFIHC
jgi:hypothetical protein